MIAAERTRRICHGLELDPLYVDTTIRRWQQFTGKEALLEGSSKSFAEIEVERAQNDTTAHPGLPPVRMRTRPSHAANGKEL